MIDFNNIFQKKLIKVQAAKALEAAANNESGAAGAGMGMGMGFAMAQQMGSMFGQQQTQQTSNNNPNAVGGGTPPPLPQQTQYFYALNGQQAGPATIAELTQLFATRTINADTLVWKQGMTNWAALNTVSELQSILGSTPPPLPGN